MIDVLPILTGMVHNIGLFSGIFAAFSLFQGWMLGRQAFLNQILHGIIFGSAAGLSMFTPVTIATGYILDARDVILVMPGLFCGPYAALLAGAISTSTRWYIGGQGVLAGISSIALASLSGAVLGYYLSHARQSLITFKQLALFAALFSAANSLCFLFLLPEMTEQVWEKLLLPLTALFVANVVGIVILGGLLLIDIRRQHLLDSLRESEQKISRAMSARTEFLAMMSHEIRTPMNGIIGFSDILTGTQLDEYQTYCLRQVKTSGKVLLKLIDDILDYSKLEAGKLAIMNQPFEVRKAVEEAFSQIQNEGDMKNNRMVLTIDETCPKHMRGDQNRLRQILYNILSNAVKFTEDGEIRVHATVTASSPEATSPDTLQLTITDTGIGIPEAKQREIFEPFTQADCSVTRKFSGAGLGLAIVRKLVDLMGGHVLLNSAQNKGTEITITLPLAEVTAMDTLPPELPPAPDAHSAKPARTGYILLAEDIPMNQELAVSMLVQKGHKVDVVSNGKEAIEAARSRPYDLILMDVRMPGMSGIEASRAIRDELNIPHAELPIIAMTAHVMPHEIQACFDAGMDDFIGKPVESRRLYEKVDQWLAQDDFDSFEEAFSRDDEDSSEFDVYPLLDPAQVAQFIEFMGQDQMIAAYDDFRLETERRLLVITATGFQPGVMEEEIHALASTSGNLGMARVSKLCRHTMAHIDSLTLDQRREAVDRLRATIHDSYGAFDGYMNKLLAA